MSIATDTYDPSDGSPFKSVPESQMRWFGGIITSFLIIYFAVVVWGSGLRDYASPEYQKYVGEWFFFLLMIFSALTARELIPLSILIVRDFHYQSVVYPRLWEEHMEIERKARHDEMIAKYAEKQVKARRSKQKPIGEPIDLKQWVGQRSVSSGGYVYVLKDIDVSQTYKIGKTYKPYKRMKAFGVHLPFAVELIHVITCDNADRVESMLHRRFADKRRGGEWFALDNEDVEWLKLHHEMNGSHEQ